MPVDFLTDTQLERYGRYTGSPTQAQLSRYFYLSDTDHEMITEHRGEHNRLGFALQLCTARFLGTLLADPTEVPSAVIANLSAQLGISGEIDLAGYRTGKTKWIHANEVRQRFGYREFTDQPDHFRFVRWLYLRSWLGAERPSVLFDLATARLVEHKILLPGATVLARLVASVRDRAAARLWRMLALLPDVGCRQRLENLLVVPPEERQSSLDRLRRVPVRVSAPALTEALVRLNDIRDLGLEHADLTRVPPNRIRTLAHYASGAKAQTISRMQDERRVATLVAFVVVLRISAQDDALNLLEQVLVRMLARNERAGQMERLRTIGDYDEAVFRLRAACLALLDPAAPDPSARLAAVFNAVSLEDLKEAVVTVNTLTQPSQEDYHESLLNHYSHVRRFLPTLLRTIAFDGTEPAQPIIEALRYLASIEGKRNPSLHDAPLEVVPASWRNLVIDSQEKIDRRFYTFCVLEQLQEALHRRDMFVEPSDRWGDPRRKLLQGAEWEATKPRICLLLEKDPDAHKELAALDQQLNEAYRRTNANLPANTAIRIEKTKGREALILTGLEKQDEPSSLIRLREAVSQRLPLVELPEIPLEMDKLTGFTQEFTHLSEGSARVEDLPLSICAVLIAEACNIGLEPVIQPGNPALTRSRLSWVQQNYFRAETLARANARFVEAQTRIALAREWGGGEVASADGLRFTVPVRTINAGPNPKYFHTGKGVTYLNYTSDQFVGFHGIVIPGTLRDSLFILDGLLEQITGLQPVELMADTAAYSDVVFGLFWLLGYQFSPRLADLGEARFWRMGPKADCGELSRLAIQKIKTKLIIRNWDDLLRVAGSLKMGKLSASELMRTLQCGKRVTTLAKAIAEVGRVAKTLYLLAYIDDEAYRRRIQIQLNRGESRHNLARTVFHGQRGELRQRYREGQEEQLGALGLMVNMIVLWNTLYMDAALSQLRLDGYDLLPADVARLSPLGFSHINMLGRYSFSMPEAVKLGQLRPLREPDKAEEIF